jgi:hypothetical protein
MNEQRSHTYGVMGEFETAEELLHAVEKTREAGFHDFDAFAPFPVEGLSEAMGLKWSEVPIVTLLGGLCGGLGGFFFQVWCNVSSYPQNIGGRPLNSWPAFIPVTFELTILGASISAVLGMLAFNKLPQPHHPVFSMKRFSSASNDRFYLCIEASDPKFNLTDSAKFLQSVHAQHVSEVQDD